MGFLNLLAHKGAKLLNIFYKKCREIVFLKKNHKKSFYRYNIMNKMSEDIEST